MLLFNEMGLSEELLLAVNALGFEKPTPIQGKVIPALLQKKQDIIGLAQTGTGKTAAYGIPALEYLQTNNKYPQVLVLSPTRELCLQISRDIESFGRFKPGLEVVSVYGGASIEQQIKSLRNGAQVVVATPGRAMDLIRRKRLDLSRVSMVILDEADEMLKMGFREDVDIILAETPAEKTTLLFSATMSADISAIAKKYMSTPLEITLGYKNAGAEQVNHVYYMVHASDRYSALKRIVDNYPGIYGIVFCRTRQETKDVADSLLRDGYNAEALHGDLSQSQRDHVMKRFRDKNLSLLVATDVAARGLDVNNLSHVINYNLPEDSEVYTHRSGRTGRAGREGISASVINLKEKGKIARFEKELKKQFIQEKVPSGEEICERQMLHLVQKTLETPVDHQRMAPFMEKLASLWQHMDKEEIIKSFVSAEFNRFLDYYKDAKDLNVSEAREKRSGLSDQARRNRNVSMRRVIFNVGKGMQISKREIIALCSNMPETRNVEIGHIEIFKRVSAVEIQSNQVQAVLKSLNRSVYRGIRIEAEENENFAGNDFRDRKKKRRN